MQASLRRIGSIASNRNTCDKWIQNYWHGAMWHAAFNLVSCNVFGHLLDLDLNFHGHRRTGQIMRVLDHGASSIQDIVSIMLFSTPPQMIDTVVASLHLHRQPVGCTMVINAQLKDIEPPFV
eukprot:GHRR01008077.1.p1 GENE.GHRR01008077.1~~GHRR01008077.1.p1  ORF type:complete len:122 (+),score=26.68 GHRR01008077.1:674-1039(+)